MKIVIMTAMVAALSASVVMSTSAVLDHSAEHIVNFPDGTFYVSNECADVILSSGAQTALDVHRNISSTDEYKEKCF